MILPLTIVSKTQYLKLGGKSRIHLSDSDSAASCQCSEQGIVYWRTWIRWTGSFATSIAAIAWLGLGLICGCCFNYGASLRLRLPGYHSSTTTATKQRETKIANFTAKNSHVSSGQWVSFGVCCLLSQLYFGPLASAYSFGVRKCKKQKTCTKD